MITDEGVIEFANNGQKFPNLTHFCLRKNEISDEGAKAMAEIVNKIQNKLT